MPATYEDASYWFTRLMAHYPRMDTDNKAILIGDLSGWVVKNQISHCAIVRVYHELWQAVKEDNPWPPKSGDIIDMLKEQMEVWRGYHADMTTTALPPPPEKKEDKPLRYGAEVWHDMDPEAQTRLLADLSVLPAGPRAVLAKSYEVPPDKI